MISQISPLIGDFCHEVNMFKILGKITSLGHEKHHFEVALETRQTYGFQTYGAPSDAE